MHTEPLVFLAHRVWHAFTNPAREDNLILHHWVKGSEDESEGKRNTKYTSVALITQVLA